MKLDLKKLKVKELSCTEVKLINGGGAGFTWLGQVCGYFSNVYDAWAGTPEGRAAQQALRDFQ